MDPVTLSAGLAALFTPLVPFLAGIGEAAAQTAAKEAGQRLGEETFQRVIRLWNWLWPRLDRQDMARRAVAGVAAEPHAADWQATLARELAPVLRKEPRLAREAAEVLRQLPEGGSSRSEAWPAA
jgi:hypothetical protein